MKRLLLILLLTIPFVGFGQGWEKTYGGPDWDLGHSVQQTTDGGYIICGTTGSSPNGAQDNDVYLIKTDSKGDTLWTRTFGNILPSSQDWGYSVHQTTDGGYIICGETPVPSQTADIWLIKTDSIGDSLWTKTFGSGLQDVGRSVQQTTDGGYIICGGIRFFLNGASHYDVYLVKTNSIGDALWTRILGGINTEIGHSVQQTTDGGYIICGGTRSFGNGGSDVYLIKTDTIGDTLWVKTFGGTNDDWGSSVQQTTDGGYIICGGTEYFGNGGGDVYLIKTDTIGDTLWTKTFGGTNDDWGSSVQQTTDGGYIICGSTANVNGIDSLDVYLVKTNSIGDTLWTKTFGGTNEDWGSSVQQTTDGGYIITGYTNSFGNGMSDVYLIKTDASGNATSTFNIPTPSSNRKLQKVVDILGRQTKGKKNEPLFYIYDDETVEKRIIIE